MSRNQPGCTDAHALRLINAGRIVCDPLTGVILVDGKPRGTSDRSSGYQKVYAAGRYMQSHRVLWLFIHGAIPAGHVINHRDGNRRNNRIENLEAVTPQQNALHAQRSASYRGTYPDAIAPDLSDMANTVPDRERDPIEDLMQPDFVKSNPARRIA